MKLLNRLENGKALVYAHDKLKGDKDFVKLLFGDIEIVSLEDLEMVEDILEYVDEDLLEEKDLVLYILQKLHEAVANLVNSLDKEDEDMADDIMDIYEDFFEDLDDDLRADKEVVLKMFTICDEFKKALTKEAGFNDDIVEECLDLVEDILEEVDEDLLEDEDFMKELIEKYPYISEIELEDEEDEDEKEGKDENSDDKENGEFSGCEDEEVDLEEDKCECKKCSCEECKCDEEKVVDETPIVETKDVVKVEEVTSNLEDNKNE